MDRFDQLLQPPVFVIGYARSGTTWVQEIFGAHPQVASIFESRLFAEEQGLGILFAPEHHGNGTGLGRLLARTDLLAYTRLMARQVLSHALAPHHRFLVEKTPQHVWVVPLIREVFPAARFIFVLRDGRDVCVSTLAAAASWAPEWRRTFARSVRGVALGWRTTVELGLRRGRELGSGDFLIVRYEDLKANPLPVYRRLFDFAHVPYDEPLLQRIFDATEFDRNRRPDERGFYRGGRVGDWRRLLSLSDALTFNLAAGQLLIELGYERSRWWLPNPFHESVVPR